MINNCRMTEDGFECGGPPRFKVGDPRPSDKYERIEWARVHDKAKIDVVRCGDCGELFFVTEKHFKCDIP